METVHKVNWNLTDSAEKKNDKEAFLVPKYFVIFYIKYFHIKGSRVFQNSFHFKTENLKF